MFQFNLPGLAGLTFCIVDVVDLGADGQDLKCSVLGDGRSPSWQLGVVYPFFISSVYQQHVMSHSFVFQRANRCGFRI